MDLHYQSRIRRNIDLTKLINNDRQNDHSTSYNTLLGDHLTITDCHIETLDITNSSDLVDNSHQLDILFDDKISFFIIILCILIGNDYFLIKHT